MDCGGLDGAWVGCTTSPTPLRTSRSRRPTTWATSSRSRRAPLRLDLGAPRLTAARCACSRASLQPPRKRDLDSGGSGRRGSTCTWRRRGGPGRSGWSSPSVAGGASRPTGTGRLDRLSAAPGARRRWPWHTPASVDDRTTAHAPTADGDPGARGPDRRRHPARPGRGGRRSIAAADVHHAARAGLHRSARRRRPRRARRGAAGERRLVLAHRHRGLQGLVGLARSARRPTSTWPRTCRAPTGTPCTRSATASSSSRAPTPAATASAALPAAASSSRTPPRRARSSTPCTGTSPGCASRRASTCGPVRSSPASTAAGTCTSAPTPAPSTATATPTPGTSPRAGPTTAGTSIP